MLFGYIMRKIHFLMNYNRTQHEENRKAHQEDTESKTETGKDLSQNLNTLEAMLSDSSDLKVHSFRTGPDKSLSGALVYFDGMVNNTTLTQAIMRPLMAWNGENTHLPTGKGRGNLLDVLAQEVLNVASACPVQWMEELVSGCLSGHTILLLEDCPGGLDINTEGWEHRQITEPQSETVVRGPREGFTEDLRTNITMLRRKIRSGQLHVEQMNMGEKTRTAVSLLYLKDVADPRVVKTVKTRLDLLDLDSVLESGYLVEYIEDAPFSLFSTVGYSEKPDVIAARVLEGRVAVLVDGTPFVLTAPMLFVESFQTAEDYYARPLYSSLIRLLRFIAYLMTIFLPAVYIALTVFHQELVPTQLLFTFANAREGTPFPASVEVTTMMFTYDILREAGIRLPRPVGQAISIVGALVMGEAAVEAGLVGAPTVITVALTAVTSFLIPMQNNSTYILRYIMIALASFAGIYGISMGLLSLLIHLASLTSFGVPYFDGLSWTRNLQDSVARMPLWTMTRRPKYIAHGDIKRRHFFVPPRPYSEEEGEEGGPEGDST